MTEPNRPRANLRDQVAYESGLLQAQQMANEAFRNATSDEARNALAALSTDLVVERQKSAQWRQETIASQSGPAPENEQDGHS